MFFNGRIEVVAHALISPFFQYGSERAFLLLPVRFAPSRTLQLRLALKLFDALLQAEVRRTVGLAIVRRRRTGERVVPWIPAHKVVVHPWLDTLLFDQYLLLLLHAGGDHLLLQFQAFLGFDVVIILRAIDPVQLQREGALARGTGYFLICFFPPF